MTEVTQFIWPKYEVSLENPVCRLDELYESASARWRLPQTVDGWLGVEDDCIQFHSTRRLGNQIRENGVFLFYDKTHFSAVASWKPHPDISHVPPSWRPKADRPNFKSTYWSQSRRGASDSALSLCVAPVSRRIEFAWTTPVHLCDTNSAANLRLPNSHCPPIIQS